MKFNLSNIRQLPNLVKELIVGLNKLDFNNNFESFEKEITIAPSTVAEIRNELTFIPNKRIIIKQNVEAAISDSSTKWTNDFVYLENHNGSNTVILKVIFMR